jgi:hypothetical protein
VGLRELFNFNGGVKPSYNKESSNRLPIMEAPLPAELVIPLHQSIGGMPRPLVGAGDIVAKGQLIGAPDGMVSAAVHASTSGLVKAVEPRVMAHASGLSALCVIIEPDGLDRWCDLQPVPWRSMKSDEVRDALRDAGVVGLGGAVATVRDAAVGWARKLPVRRDPATGHWTGPFVMAAFNTRMVRRSNALLGWRYGRAFRYREVVDFGTGVRAPVLAGGMSAGLAGLFGAMAFEPTRAAVGRFLPKPGEGPSEAAQAAGRFRMVIRTRTTSGAAYRTTVGADYDPGYSGTAVMLGEAALALAFDGERLPGGGGVLTPATGVGQVLVDRLVAQGFTFACEKGSPSSPSR